MVDINVIQNHEAEKPFSIKDTLTVLNSTITVKSTDHSNREGVSSLVVLKTGIDRVYSLNCPVCGTKIELGIPVISEFIGKGNQALRGGRNAIMKIRQHCEAIHPNEYVWWAVPTGGDVVNVTASARMDECMRYVLEQTAGRVAIHAVRSIASNDAWSLDTKIFALCNFIHERYLMSLSLVEFTSYRIFKFKKLGVNTDLATIRNQAKSHIEKMRQGLINQCQQYAEIIFDKRTYGAYVNRLQLCYFERGRWRMIGSAASSTLSLFGSEPLPVQGASGKGKASVFNKSRKRKRTNSFENPSF